jgi:hypothetical protein
VLFDREIELLIEAGIAIHEHFVNNVYSADNVCAIGELYIRFEIVYIYVCVTLHPHRD